MKQWLLCAATFAATHTHALEASFDSNTDAAIGYRYFSSDSEIEKNSSAEYLYSYYSKIDSKFDAELANLSLDLRLFYNWDLEDEERRYYDLREARLNYSSGRWQFEAGNAVVFWGVSETINIVNVINQADLKESVDGKEKMGQGMLVSRYSGNINSFSIYYLPSFEPLDYPERPSPTIKILQDQPRFEKNADEGEWAARWVGAFDFGDVGLSYFNGIRRDPLLVRSGESAALIPLYVKSEHMALDSVLFWSDAIVKTELLLGKEQEEDFFAYNLGFEYPTFPSFSWWQDAAWIAEFVFDSRDEKSGSMGQKDIFLGGRFNMGDLSQYELRIISGLDLDHYSKYLDFSFRHRLTDYIQWSAKIIQFMDVGDEDYRIKLVEDEDFIELELRVSF